MKRLPSVLVTIDALVCAYLLWTVIDSDGWGRARLYLYTQRVARDTAQVLATLAFAAGKLAIAAELAYWKEVRK
jgi:hypothetical protein